MKKIEECAFIDCHDEAVHTIDDAIEYPKIWNGKRICKYHKDVRELMKQEPECDKI